MVGGGEGVMDAQEAEQFRVDPGLEVRPLLRVDFHGETKYEDPELLEGELGGLSLQVLEAGSHDKLADEVGHHKDNAVAKCRGGECGLAANKVVSDNVVFLPSPKGVEGVMRLGRGRLDSEAVRAGRHED